MAEQATSIPEFGVPRPNEERRDGGIGIVFCPKTQRFAVGRQQNNGSYRLFSGGIDPQENRKEGTLREVTEESGLYDFQKVEYLGQAYAHYHNTLRKVNRVALADCYLILLASDKLQETELEAHETFELCWVGGAELLADLEARNGNRDNDHWIYFVKKAFAKLGEWGYSL